MGNINDFNKRQTAEEPKENKPQKKRPKEGKSKPGVKTPSSKASPKSIA